MQNAFDLIDKSLWSGADLCKFQLYSVDTLFPSKRIEVNEKNYYDIVKSCELTFDQAKELFQYGQKVGIEVFFSVFDVERVKWCEDIGVKRYKVAFGQRKNNKLLSAIRSTGKPIIVSDNHPHYLDESKYLYCVPHYPTLIKEINFYEMGGFDGF